MSENAEADHNGNAIDILTAERASLNAEVKHWRDISFDNGNEVTALEAKIREQDHALTASQERVKELDKKSSEDWAKIANLERRVKDLEEIAVASSKLPYDCTPDKIGYLRRGALQKRLAALQEGGK